MKRAASTTLTPEPRKQLVNDKDSFLASKLPWDVFSIIISLLDKKSIFCMAQVCKLTNQQAWPLQTSLSINTTFHLPPAELLSNLKTLTTKTSIQSAWLTKLVSLEHLYFKGMEFAGDQLLPLLTNLKTLDLRSIITTTDKTLLKMSTLTNLTSLNVSGCDELTSTALLRIKQFTNLTYLNFSFCPGIITGFKHLTGLTKLEYLHFADCNEIRGSSLESLSLMTNLRVLDMKTCPDIAPASFKFLKLLTRLEKIDVRATRTTQEAVRNQLPLLSKDCLILARMSK